MRNLEFLVVRVFPILCDKYKSIAVFGSNNHGHAERYKSMSSIDNNRQAWPVIMKRPTHGYTVHSSLGGGKSVEQYRAALSQDTSVSHALYCYSDFPKPRHEWKVEHVLGRFCVVDNFRANSVGCIASSHIYMYTYMLTSPSIYIRDDAMQRN